MKTRATPLRYHPRHAERPVAASPGSALHLATRELLKTSPASPDWPEVKRELRRCAELRRQIIAAGWFN